MKTLLSALQAVWDLFVDDEFLAAAILATVASAAAIIGFGGPPLAVGAALFMGLLAILVLSVLRTARR